MCLSTSNRLVTELSVGGQAESDFAEAGSLAVVGPNSGLIAYGNYAGRNKNNTTPVQGLQRLVPSLVWEEGCAMATNNTSGTESALSFTGGHKSSHDESPDDE